MFSNLNWWEIAVLALLGLFIFGPERLPKLISDVVGMIRTVRNMARNATSDLSRELGTDIRLEDLHPKTFVRKHLLSEEDEATLRRPFEDAYKDVKRMADDVDELRTLPQDPQRPAAAPAKATQRPEAAPSPAPASSAAAPAPPAPLAAASPAAASPAPASPAAAPGPPAPPPASERPAQPGGADPQSTAEQRQYIAPHHVADPRRYDEDAT